MSARLLRDRRFWPIFFTQFLGAFNDNILKNALVILVTIKSLTMGGVSSSQMVALCGGLFILPFFLFSATAGQLADRFSKSRLVFWVKVWEVLLMLLAAYGFLTDSLIVLLSALFMTGLQSTFFGPVKYSILPHLLRDEELVSGTGWVEMGTFLAILLGTILGGALIAVSHWGPWLTGLAMVTVALSGCFTSAMIRPIPPVAPELRWQLNPIGPTREVLKLTMKTRSIFLTVLGISWFWFLGAALLTVLPPYCKEFLKAEESVITLFLALFSVGVGMGSMLCGRLNSQRPELGVVPVGSLGMSLFAFDLFLTGHPETGSPGGLDPLTLATFLSAPGGLRVALDLFLFAVCGGLYIVPLYTFLQQKSRGEERSRIIAGNNIVNSFFMVCAAALLVFLFGLKLSFPVIFLILAVLNLAVAVYLYAVIPEFILRFICWIIANVMYRLKVIGRENIPSNGPALLVANHVSFVDWLIVASACPRPVRFVMHYKFFAMPLAGRIFKNARVIPIAGSREDPEILESAFVRIAEELQNGQLVCYFPEGRLTRDGAVRKFRPGVEWIVQTTPVPVVPMALNGLWGSFFSRKYGKPMSKPFRRFWSRICLVIGEPVPPEEASAGRLHQAVTELQLQCNGSSTSSGASA